MKKIFNVLQRPLGKLTTMVVVSLTLIQSVPAHAAILTGFNGSTLAAGDDNSSSATSFGFTANFFGTNYSNAFVNNNGNLTFASALGTYTPFGLTSTSTPIIAPFFADVDTNGVGTVTYGTGAVNGFNAFAATYTNVGYFSSKTDKTNKFQVALISRPDTGTGNFDIEFNYDQIQWETGDASSGSNGLGGSSARAGYSNGTTAPGSSFELVGSAVNGAFLDGGPNSLVTNSLNSGVPGRYIFNARNGTVVVPPPTTSVPEPFTIIGTLIGGTAAFHMRKKLKAIPK